MPDFAAFFASGQVADFMVALLLIEALALLAFWRVSGRGLPPRSVIALVLPGVFFALALRAALTGAWWGRGRGGSVCLNSSWAFPKWVSASVRPPSGLMAAR
ncbi:MAG: hypothetical protein ACK53U_11625 [Alphaproteobacteria bacterium]|jgi:hypothetical protein